MLSFFSTVSGHLGDMYEARRILGFGFVFTAITFPLLSLISSYLQIIAVLALAAVGVSVFHPVGTALVSQSYRRGISFGLFEVAGCTGALIITLSFSFLATSLGWRMTSVVLAIPSLIIGLTFLLSCKSLRYADSVVQPEDNPLKFRSLVLFYFARGAQIFGGVAILSFIPLFAVDVGGLLPEKASFFPLFIWTGGIPGMLICAAFSDSYSPLKIIFFLMFTIVPAILGISLPLPLFITFIFLVIFGFCHLGAWISQNVWLSRVTCEQTRGKIFGGIMKQKVRIVR